MVIAIDDSGDIEDAVDGEVDVGLLSGVAGDEWTFVGFLCGYTYEGVVEVEVGLACLGIKLASGIHEMVGILGHFHRLGLGSDSESGNEQQCY